MKTQNTAVKVRGDGGVLVFSFVYRPASTAEKTIEVSVAPEDLPAVLDELLRENTEGDSVSAVDIVILKSISRIHERLSQRLKSADAESSRLRLELKQEQAAIRKLRRELDDLAQRAKQATAIAAKDRK